MVLAGLDAFAEEFASHVDAGTCAPGTRQTVPCVTRCPAHVNVPAYIALAEEGRLVEAVKMIRKDNPFPTACALVCEHPCEERCRRTMVDAPVNIRGIKKYIVDTVAADTVETPAPLPRHGQTRRGGGCRPLGAHLRLLPGAHGSFGDGIRTSQSPGRHDALRHSRLSAAPRAARRGYPRRAGCRRHRGAYGLRRSDGRDAHAGGRVRRRVRGRGRPGRQDPFH